MAHQDQPTKLWTIVEGDSEAERFGRYLCGELRWELEQNPQVESPLRAAPRDEFRAIRYARYEQVEVEYRGRRYRARLTWRPDQPPVIDEVIEDAIS
jgi:hypothetical protein